MRWHVASSKSRRTSACERARRSSLSSPQSGERICLHFRLGGNRTAHSPGTEVAWGIEPRLSGHGVGSCRSRSYDGGAPGQP